jgi:hypothetical protein
MPTFRYSLIQYVPSPVRDERVNVGVIVLGTTTPFFGAKALGKQQRGRLARMGFAKDFNFLDDLIRELEDSKVEAGQLPIPTNGSWDEAAVERAGVEWANTIQLTPPRAAIHERPDALLESLFAELVADPASRRRRARDRRWIRRKVLTGLRQNLAAVPHFDFDAHVRKDTRVAGELEQHSFDIQLVNGQPLKLIQGLALEGVATRDREVDALAWTIDDVQKTSAIPISVLSVGDGAVLDRAQRIYEGLGAQVVREPELDNFLAAAASGLVVAVNADAASASAP